MNCARCHDHKFDPVRQTEFYQVSAALGGTFQGDERDVVNKESLAKLESRIAEVRKELEELSKVDTSKPEEARRRQEQQLRLESMVQLLSAGPVHTTVPKQPPAWRLLARGDFRQPRDIITPAGLTAIAGDSLQWQLPADAPEAERRTTLAGWIANPNNPLTSRIIVNRLWGYHFGDGLVRTASDFGFQGGAPSHRELLDWLADQLRSSASGRPWSLKKIQRLILTTAAYRQSSRLSPTAAKVDSENRWIWRWSPQRLSAESFRDAVLAVSGELDRKIGGPSYRDFKVTTAGSNDNYAVFDAIGDEFNRRSLYRATVRAGTSPLLDTLDCPDPSVATPRRSVTSTPLQALSLLNNRFMEYHAGKLSERLQREATTDADRIRRAYRLAFARDPNDEELDFGARFIASSGWAEFCLVLFNSNEFIFLD